MKKLLTILFLFCFVSAYAQKLPAPTPTPVNLSTMQWSVSPDSSLNAYSGATWLWWKILSKYQADKLYAPIGGGGSFMTTSTTQTGLTGNKTSSGIYTLGGLNTPSVGFTNGAFTTTLSGPASNQTIALPALSGTVPIFASTPVSGGLVGWSGTSGAITNITALPNGTTATTQTAGDNSTKVATTAYVDASPSGTVTSIATNNGSGITGGTITTTGTIAADTAGVLVTKTFAGRFALASAIPSISFGTFGSTPNANGGSYSGGVITLQPASASFPGGVTTGTQTFAGAKTFAQLTTNAQLTVTSGGAAITGTISGTSNIQTAANTGSTVNVGATNQGSGAATLSVERTGTGSTATTNYRTSGSPQWLTGLAATGNNNYVIQNTSGSVNALSFDKSTNELTLSSLTNGLVKSTSGVLSNATASDIPSGSTNYIQNQTASYQSSTNFKISGFGVFGSEAAIGDGLLSGNKYLKISRLDNTAEARTWYTTGGTVNGFRSGLAAGSDDYTIASSTGTVGFTLTSTGNITTPGTITLADEAYSSSWNGKLEAPTKNAIWDAGFLSSATAATTYLPLAGGTLTGDVNVSKTNPAFRLTRANTSQSSLLLYNTNGTDDWLVGTGITGTNSNYRIYNNGLGSDAISIDNATNVITVALGTGAVQATAGVLSVVSDSRVKTHLGTFKGSALTAISKLQAPEYWRYNAKSGMPKVAQDVKQFSLFADKVYDVLGEEFAPTQKDGMHSLSDRALLSLAIQAIQELQAEVKKLKK